MRWATLAALLLGAACWAQLASSSEDCETVGLVADVQCGDGGVPPLDPPSFAFAPLLATTAYAAGAGFSDAGVRFCDVLQATDKVGSWECFNGDATAIAWDGGTNQYVAVGTIAAQSQTFCPFGSDCKAVTVQEIETAEAWKGDTAYASGADSVTFCILNSIDSAAVSQGWHFGQSTGGTPDTLGATLWLRDGDYLFYVCDGANCVSPVVTTTFAKRVPHFVCGRWSAAVGASICLDGTCSADSALATRSDLTAKVTIGGYNGTAHTGRTFRARGAFVTHTRLSDARIAALSKAVHGGLVTGARGEALTFTRSTGGRFCESSDGTGSFLAANIPCVAKGGMNVASATTNILLRSDTLGNAAWSDVGTPTVTSDNARAPDGALNADTLTDNDGAAFEGRSQSVSTSAEMKFNFSCFLKAGNQAQYTLRLTGTGDSAGDKTCSGTLSGSGYTRVVCRSNNAYANGISAVLAEVLVGDAVGDQGTLVVGGCQLEARPLTGPYTITAGSSVAVGVETPYFTTPATAFRSIAATHTIDGPMVGYSPLVWAYKSGSEAAILYKDSTSYAEDQADFCLAYGGGDTFGPSTFLLPVETYGSTLRSGCAWNNVTVRNSMRGSETSTNATDIPVATTRVYVGSFNNAARDSTVSDVCADTTSTRCYPSAFSATNAIAYLGDSTVKGDGAIHNRPPHEVDKIAKRAVHNFGTGGRTMAQCLSDYRTHIKGKGYAVVVVQCAVNSIASDVTPAAVLVTLSTLTAEARADGSAVVVVDLLPWKNSASWSAGRQTATNTYNAALPAWCVSNSATCVATYATLGGEGGDADVLLAAYDSGDKIHLTAAGDIALGTLVAAGVP